LAELAIVSEVNVVAGTPSDPSGVDVSVAPATSGKCLRCWNYREEVGQLAAYPDLCGRCATVVERIA
jgi:isoleucyl-tRNA synthetase